MVAVAGVVATVVNVVNAAVSAARNAKTRVMDHVRVRVPMASQQKRVSHGLKVNNVPNAVNVEAATAGPSVKPSRKARKCVPNALTVVTVVTSAPSVASVARVASARTAMLSRKRRLPPCQSKQI